MSHRLDFLALALVAVVTAFAHPAAETSVKERAEHYYKAWQKKDVDAVWSFLSPDIRHHDGAEEYRKNLSAFFQDTTLVGFQVTHVSVDKDVAWVEAAVVVNIESGKEHKYNVVQKTRWILVATDKDKTNLDWYLEESPQMSAQIWPEGEFSIKKTERIARSAGSLDKYNGPSILALNFK
jgi:hypothetical protein